MSDIHREHWLTNLEVKTEPDTPGSISGSILEKRRWKLVPNTDPHLTWGSFYLRAEDTLILLDENFIRVRVDGPRSPTVNFKYGKGTDFPEYFSIVMCGALCKHEVVGSTAERMGYDLVWQGLVTSAYFRGWVAKECPSFWRMVKDTLPALVNEEEE